MNDEEFFPDAEMDRLIARAMQSRVEAVSPLDLASRAARLGREQERVLLAEELRQRLAQWERRKWWQRGASAVAAVVVLAMLWFGAQKLKRMELAKGEAAGTSVTTDDGTTGVDADATASSTSSSFDGPIVLGGIALLGAVALLAIGRSLGGSEQNWAFATPRLT